MGEFLLSCWLQALFPVETHPVFTETTKTTRGSLESLPAHQVSGFLLIPFLLLGSQAPWKKLLKFKGQVDMSRQMAGAGK